ncbi:MAG: alpha/beta hydrolase-fold protein [bacterium]
MSAHFVIPAPATGPFPLGPDSQRQPSVPCGTLTRHLWRSTIFPGTVRDYWVSVPAQYTPDKPANVMVFQDGLRFQDVAGQMRVPVVFDNLIHQGRLPVTIGIYLDPGNFPGLPPVVPPWQTAAEARNREFEYTMLTDQYARFLLDEILPEVGRSYNLTQSAAGRAVCGASNGGLCAFTVAWERPDAFSKVFSQVGAFVNFNGAHNYPPLIRRTPRRPIRVFLQTGTHDLEIQAGNFTLANLEMAAALDFAGYDYRFAYGDGDHGLEHGGAILPAVLEWLWR